MEVPATVQTEWTSEIAGVRIIFVGYFLDGVVRLLDDYRYRRVSFVRAYRKQLSRLACRHEIAFSFCCLDDWEVHP